MEQKEKPLTRAQELRKNATKEENHLWYDFLRTYPVQFLRQKPFGPYIVDFYCHKAKLAIELDGSQHYEGNGPEQDKIRTAYLQEVEKIRVLRFTNLEIKQNFEGVCAAIDRQVRAALVPYITLHAHRARHETVQRLRRMKCLCMWAVPAYALSSHGRAAVSGRMANSAMLLHSK